MGKVRGSGKPEKKKRIYISKEIREELKNAGKQSGVKGKFLLKFEWMEEYNSRSFFALKGGAEIGANLQMWGIQAGTNDQAHWEFHTVENLQKMGAEIDRKFRPVTVRQFLRDYKQMDRI